MSSFFTSRDVHAVTQATITERQERAGDREPIVCHYCAGRGWVTGYTDPILGVEVLPCRACDGKGRV